jgi:hypothetical protein
MYIVEFIGLLLKIFIIKTAYHLCFFSPFIDDGTLASGDASFMHNPLSRTFQLVIFWYFVSYKGLSSEMNDFYQAHKSFKIKRVLLIFHVFYFRDQLTWFSGGKEPTLSAQLKHFLYMVKICCVRSCFTQCSLYANNGIVSWGFILCGYSHGHSCQI